MKKLLLFPFIMLLAMTVTACDSDSPETDGPDTEQPGNKDEDDDESGTPSPGGNGRYLVLFASRSGNTKAMAETISKSMNCDILEVMPDTPYDENYNSMLQCAQQEQATIDQGNYPSVETMVDNFDNYDLIFVGYPIWHGHMATTMQGFLHNHAGKLKGKRIALFASSGSSGISTSVMEAQNLCPDATFTETLHLTSGTLGQMPARVASWLEQIGAERNENNNYPENNSLMVNIKVGDRTITAAMEDNVAARDFLARLPLEVTLNDYANTEKIFYPSPTLTIQGAPRGCTPTPGDITIYIPWGNVAIFYKSFSASNDLIKIGRIDDSGIEALSIAGDVQVRFELKPE